MPIFCANPSRSRQVSVAGRGLALCIAIGCLAVLIMAARLKPNPAGLGTHRTMGLQACGFMNSTGLPCPSCGMTTSFSWLAHGNLAASLYVQPMGTVLAALAGVLFWAGMYIALTGQPVHQLLGGVPAKYHAIPLIGLAVLAWGWKIFIHLRGIDGWG